MGGAARGRAVGSEMRANQAERAGFDRGGFPNPPVVEKGTRAAFVKSGADTADGRRWRTRLSIHASRDGFVVGTTADHVRAAHEGQIEKRLVFGTLSLGYAGRPLDGQTTRRFCTERARPITFRNGTRRPPEAAQPRYRVEHPRSARYRPERWSRCEHRPG